VVRRIRRGLTRPGPRRRGARHARRRTGHGRIHNPGHGRTRPGCPGWLSLARRPGRHHPVGPVRRRAPRRFLAVLSPSDWDHGTPSIRCPARRGCRRPSRRRTCLAVRPAPGARRHRGSSGRHRTRPTRHNRPNRPRRGNCRYPSRHNGLNCLSGGSRRPNRHYRLNRLSGDSCRYPSRHNRLNCPSRRSCRRPYPGNRRPGRARQSDHPSSIRRCSIGHCSIRPSPTRASPMSRSAGSHPRRPGRRSGRPTRSGSGSSGRRRHLGRCPCRAGTGSQLLNPLGRQPLPACDRIPDRPNDWPGSPSPQARAPSPRFLQQDPDRQRESSRRC